MAKQIQIIFAPVQPRGIPEEKPATTVRERLTAFKHSATILYQDLQMAGAVLMARFIIWREQRRRKALRYTQKEGH